MRQIRRYLLWVRRLCLAVFLFGQFAVAAQACVSMQASPEMAFSSAQHTCHDENKGNPNACLMHCIQSDQNLDSQQHNPVAQTIAVQAVLLSASSAVAWPPQLQRPVIVTLNHSPPIPILHCRFLI